MGSPQPVHGRQAYVQDQKAQVFADRRTKRLRNRAAAERQAITESREDT